MAWGAVAGAAVSVVGSALLSDKGAGNAQQTSDAANQKQAQIAGEQWDRYKSTFAPLENDLAAKAKTYGTPAEQEAAAGRANADVTGQFDQARKQAMLGLNGSRGLNPNDPAYDAKIASTNLSEAATKAGAETQARIQARDLGFAKELDAIGIGKGIPASSANSLGTVAGNSNVFNQAQRQNYNQAQGIYGIANLAQKGFDAWSGRSSGNSSAPYESSGLGTSIATNPYGSSSSAGSTPISYERDGGIIEGKGTETSDSNPAMLSKHEAVLNAGAVRIIGRKAIEKLNQQGKLARGGIMRRPPASLPAKLMHLQGM